MASTVATVQGEVMDMWQMKAGSLPDASTMSPGSYGKVDSSSTLGENNVHLFIRC